MTLLFLALALFYGLLSLMTRVLQDQASAPASLVETEAETGAEQAMLQAAAIAVALARAEAEQRAGPLGTPAADKVAAVSPWWALHHQRQMTSAPNTRRVR